jgi:hypothetical protein
MEQLQSSIKKCIADVATNNTAREEKEAAREVNFDALWAKMFEKQEVKIDPSRPMSLRSKGRRTWRSSPPIHRRCALR